MWLSVISEQVKGVLDVRYLFRIKTRLVIITGETDDTVYRLTEDVARFEQQETETARQKGEFDNREQIKARREVDNVVKGNYDQQQKRGFSMRR